MAGQSESNLEMRCTADEAWYDGTLTKHSKDSIVVHFNDFDEDEDEAFDKSDLMDPAKLRTRVRVRSMQLQDCQCKTVYVSQRICGCFDDGDDRKYYDAEIVAINSRKHSFKVDGEQECRCRFTLLWLAGPEKGNETTVGCAEVCFLSPENPEDDPMVKNLLKSFVGNGEQRRKMVKNYATPRPRTPSPSLEVVHLKKQPSKEPSPSLSNHQVLEARSRSVPLPGSKKKRIMQQEEEVTDLDPASDNDNLNNLALCARRLDTLNGSPHSEEDEGRGYDNMRDVVERSPLIGSEGKKGILQPGKRRLVKANAKLVSPEVVPVLEKAGRKNMPFKERLKLNSKLVVHNAVVASNEAIREDIPKVPKRRVKVKTSKTKPASQAELQKETLQKGEQIVEQRMTLEKHKLIDVEDQPSRLNSKHDTGAEPNGRVVEPNDAVAKPKEQPKRKRGRPRKIPQPEAKIVNESSVAKKQQVLGFCTQARQSPREEETTDVNVGKPASGISNKEKKKRPRDERPQGSEELVSDKPTRMHMVGDEGHSLFTRHVNATNGGPYHKAKQSIPDRFREIEDRFGGSANRAQRELSLEKIPSPSPAAEERRPSEEDACEDQPEEVYIRVSSPQDDGATQVGGQDETTNFEGTCPIGNKRRRAQLVITDDEMEDVPEKPSRKQNAKDCGLVDSSPVGQDEYTPAVTALPPGLDGMRDTRMLLIENMERNASAYDAIQLLQAHTEGVCAVHILPNSEFEVSTTGYVVYQDNSSAGKALLWLTNSSCFVVSPKGRDGEDGRAQGHVLENVSYAVCPSIYLGSEGRRRRGIMCWASTFGFLLLRSLDDWFSYGCNMFPSLCRPWIASLAPDMYGPRMCGFAAHTAYKLSDSPGLCGIISDQPSLHPLILVTKNESRAYVEALKSRKQFEQHKKWRKELYKRIFEDEKKCS